MKNGKKSSERSPKGWQRAFFAVFLLFLHAFSFAQFYTGSEQTFGRKRVQYDKFIWMYYRFNGFDVYFNEQGKNLALYTAAYVRDHLGEMEAKVGFQTQEGLRFIVFNRLTDLKQSNIGYLDEKTESSANTGGVTRFLDNKVFLYFEGDYVDFERQIRRAMAELLVAQAITGAKVGTQYKNSYLMDLPAWFTRGAASYFARDWDEEMDERMAVSIQRKDFRYMAGLEGEDAAFVGHSFWHFVAQTYGQDAVSRCIRVVSTERNLKKTFSVALNTPFKDLMDKWFRYYKAEYSVDGRTPLGDSAALARTNRTDYVYDRFVLNPAGKEAAFTGNKLGRAKVYLQTVDPPRRFCIYRTGAAVNDNPDYSFPLLCFHPDGDHLGVMTEEKGRTTLIVYKIERNEKGRFKFRPIKRDAVRYRIDAFDKVNSFSFSPDGRQIALGGTVNGYPDIYLYRLGAGTRQRITYDLYDDYDPVFVPGTDLLVFASNRPDDTLRKGEKFETAPTFTPGRNFYAYDLANPSGVLFKMTHEDVRTLLKRPQNAAQNVLSFTSNKYGQTNRVLGVLGNTISHIDTAIHYRPVFHYATQSNLEPGLEFMDVQKGRDEVAQTGQQFDNKGRYSLTVNPLERILPNMDVPLEEVKVTPSRFKQQVWEAERRVKARKARQDSLARAAMQDTAGKLTREEAEKGFLSLRNALPSDRVKTTAYDMFMMKRAGLVPAADSSVSGGVSAGEGIFPPNYISMNVETEADSMEKAFPKIPPKQHMYEVQYKVNASTAQLGFDFLSACYQQFTNSQNPLYLNATASGFTQISISDLMENHRLIGGFAFSLDFSSTEYLFSYEYLERRLGHQVILHMANLKDDSYYPYRQNTYDAYYVMKYPLTPVSSLRGTVFGRYDRSMYRAIDYTSLIEETKSEMRVGLKGEWVYDHSRFITQNIYFGTRGKVWLEYYQGVINNKQNLFVFGVDFRDYRRLYKNLIWANRIAFSASFGQQKLIYYMGGVDGWVGAKFDRDVEVDPKQNYAYQTLATNMRGFHQNIRNGNTFAVINSEIRFPFVQVLSPRPVQSSFLRHLQLVAFGDIGSAWSGWNPWSKDNLFYKKTIEDGKLTVVLDKDANPIVGGFGVGIRMQVLGYFLRGDLAWGVENGILHKKPVFYFSLSTDF